MGGDTRESDNQVQPPSGPGQVPATSVALAQDHDLGSSNGVPKTEEDAAARQYPAEDTQPSSAVTAVVDPIEQLSRLVDDKERSSQPAPGPANTLASAPPQSQASRPEERTARDTKAQFPSVVSGIRSMERQAGVPPVAVVTVRAMSEKRDISKSSSTVPPPPLRQVAPPPVPPQETPSASVSKTQDATAPVTSKPRKTKLRRGKWTVEEETYVARVIQDFNSGFLDAPAGTTLRSYLSEKLQCDPMRITKKFTGDACIGKRVFHPVVKNATNAEAIEKAQSELEALERRWRRRMELQQRETAKKAASSTGHSSPARNPYALGPLPLVSAPHMTQHVVTETASWLDRASAILSAPNTTVSDSSSNPSPSIEIESQMKEVQRLIHEGPHIQRSTEIFDLARPASSGAVLIPGSSSAVSGRPETPPRGHADKRLRPSLDAEEQEDAEAMLGFLRSVRAEQAATTTPASKN